MDSRAWRKLAAILGILFVLGSAPSWAGQGETPAARRSVDLVARARAWMGELLIVAGLVPAGRPIQGRGEEGPMIDPDGIRLDGDLRCRPTASGCGRAGAPLTLP